MGGCHFFFEGGEVNRGVLVVERDGWRVRRWVRNGLAGF